MKSRTQAQVDSRQRPGARFDRAVSRVAALPVWQIVSAYALVAALVGVLIVLVGLPDTLLYLGLIPVILSAVYHPKRGAYIGTAAVLVATSLATVWFVSTDLRESVETIILSALSVFVLCELVFTLTATRRAAQRAQLESTQMLQATLDAIPDIIGIQGLNHEVLAYNEAGYRYLETTPDDVRGRKCYELIGRKHPCDICATTRAYQTKKPAQVERYEPSLDRWLDVRAYPIVDEEGTIVRLIEHLRDITDRKNAERELEESKRFLQEMFDAIQDGVCVLDRELNVVRVNKWMERLYAHQMPVVGRKCYDIYQCRDTPCPWCPSRKTLDTGEVFHHTVPYPSEQEPTGWFEVSAFPLRDENGEVSGIIEYVKDITERLAHEREKETLQEQLLQAQKMEAIGRLAGGIAHDFNNILTAVQGYTSLLLQAFDPGESELPPRDEVRSNLEEVLAASSKAQALTSQLLAFGRKQVVRPSRLQISEVFRSMQPMLRRLIGEDVLIHEDLNDDHHHVFADPSQIEQIVLNLAVNARDAMPAGGTLAFNVSNVGAGDEAVQKHTGKADAEFVVLRVSDTGSGMTKEVKQHLFEPFFTTKDVGKGTGLGLATVYAIVDQLEGFIDVHSEVGRGTEIGVYLPRAGARGGTDSSEDTEEPLLPGSERVLVAEDESSVRSLIERVLTSCGYTVLVADTPEAALHLCEEYKGEIDLLITDVVMPQMSGVDLARRVVGMSPAAGILFMSGYTETELPDSETLGAKVHFIAKPFSPGQLTAQVRNVLGARH